MKDMIYRPIEATGKIVSSVYNAFRRDPVKVLSAFLAAAVPACDSSPSVQPGDYCRVKSQLEIQIDAELEEEFKDVPPEARGYFKEGLFVGPGGHIVGKKYGKHSGYRAWIPVYEDDNWASNGQTVVPSLLQWEPTIFDYLKSGDVKGAVDEIKRKVEEIVENFSENTEGGK